jgi:hypothetical protein
MKHWHFMIRLAPLSLIQKKVSPDQIQTKWILPTTATSFTFYGIGFFV